MSLLNISVLNETTTVRGITQPEEILNIQRDSIIHALNPEGATEVSRDGMDCALIALDKKSLRLKFAGANNGIWIVRENELIEYYGDKQPIGSHEGTITPFRSHEILLKQGDMIYLLSDGFADQFGGPQGKKFKYRKLKEKLLAISSLEIKQQQLELKAEFEEWKGKLEQVDDVLIIGVRV